MRYETIFEDDNYLVINKPAGLLTHGAEHIKEPSLADQLLADYPELAGIGEDPARPGIIHRLDKLVSGLLVITRTQTAFDDLKKQFQARTVKKYYTALVHGRTSKDEDTISFPIRRSSKGHKMAALPLTYKGTAQTEGRGATTEFTVLKRFINYTLLQIRIKTGRTHQIRVHLSAYGHPIVGDDLYGTKKTRIKNEKLGLGRIFLVAHQLEFRDLQGEMKKFKLKLPEELERFLQIVK